MKILIAEDEFVSRRVLKAMLESYGDVHVAVDGQEALDAFTASLDAGDRYDLVCLDIMMPGMDGKDAAKAIREREKERGIRGSSETPILMTTALSDPKTVIDSYYRGGATAYVVKPIEREALTKALREMKLIGD
jgi:two-component system chemotaxis response regulator CheY